MGRLLKKKTELDKRKKKDVRLNDHDAQQDEKQAKNLQVKEEKKKQAKNYF